jgi:hypothetical protein
MKIQYLLKLGPVELSDDTVNVYLRVKESGEVAPPVFCAGDLDGLQELLAADAEPRAHLRCEPALSEAAAALGIGVQEAPTRVLQSRAAIAVFMAWGQRGVAQAGTDMALLFMQVATEFWNAHPWVYWDERQPITFQFEGALEHVYEGSIFGSKEQGFGLALYEDKGALDQLLAMQTGGNVGAAKKLPASGVMLDDRPSYALEALAAAGQVPRLPIPIKTGSAGAAVPNPTECLALVAALRAASELSSAKREASCELAAHSTKLVVSVQAPQPRIRN